MEELLGKSQPGPLLLRFIYFLCTVLCSTIFFTKLYGLGTAVTLFSFLFSTSHLFLFFDSYMEPLPPGSGTKFEFENNLVGQAIPPNFVPAIEKGFKEAVNSYVSNFSLYITQFSKVVSSHHYSVWR